MIKMKALRSFGVNGSNEGKVKRGRELSAKTEQRARELESAGLAYRVEDVKAEPLPNKTEPHPSNKAAQSGPLGFHGGGTGVVAPASSLQVDPPLPKRRGRPPLNRQRDEFGS